jgi:Family of unknown function (DUF6065)
MKKIHLEDAKPKSNGSHLSLSALKTNRSIEATIVAAPHTRDWMSETVSGFAYRCIPLVIANQFGWFILNSKKFSAIWNGSNDQNSIEISYFDQEIKYKNVISHFGYGVLSMQIPYVFQTSAGYGLQVRGPTNMPKDGIYALDGLVETDWSITSFLMNWKFTRPNHMVTFEEGEPFCMLVPTNINEIENYSTSIEMLKRDSVIGSEHIDWVNDRLNLNESNIQESRWRGHYARGVTPNGSSATTHKVRLHLSEFQVKKKSN